MKINNIFYGVSTFNSKVSHLVFIVDFINFFMLIFVDFFFQISQFYCKTLLILNV